MMISTVDSRHAVGLIDAVKVIAVLDLDSPESDNQHAIVLPEVGEPAEIVQHDENGSQISGVYVSAAAEASVAHQTVLMRFQRFR
jgi:hypothetical protein